jgi:hypothetical protein
MTLFSFFVFFYVGEDCDYVTDVKSNLNRHMDWKHGKKRKKLLNIFNRFLQRHTTTTSIYKITKKTQEDEVCYYCKF